MSHLRVDWMQKWPVTPSSWTLNPGGQVSQGTEGGGLCAAVVSPIPSFIPRLLFLRGIQNMRKAVCIWGSLWYTTLCTSVPQTFQKVTTVLTVVSFVHGIVHVPPLLPMQLQASEVALGFKKAWICFHHDNILRRIIANQMR